MSYTDLTFWLFLGAVLAGVAALPVSWRSFWLLLASLWFYAAPDPWRLLWLGGVCAVALFAAAPSEGEGSATRRGQGIAALVLLLIWARFFELAGLPDPRAPPGLSFIVFTAIALIVESANHPATGRWTDAVLHLVWFPKLLAGPIERGAAFIPQFSAISVRPSLASLGLAYLVVGLVKKVVIADNLAPVVAAGFGQPAFATPADLLLAVYAFPFQIYCDFSGYSDIAIGLSALVGLRLSRNFDRPLLAATVTDFWSRRWHITLGSWFRDFVFIPLGGSRRGPARRLVNLMVVFLLSGLWHAGLGYGVGWGFILWGAMNGAFVAAESFVPGPVRTVPRILRGIVTFHLILLSWIFFRSESVADATTLIGRLCRNALDLPALLLSHPYTGDDLLCASLAVLLIVAEAAAGRSGIPARLAAAPLPLRWAGLYTAIGLLLLAGRWQDTEFIYAGF